MTWRAVGCYPEFAATILGPLSLVTAPTGFAVTLGETKANSRITLPDDDTLLVDRLNSATNICETLIDGHRQFLTATYDLPVMQWWEGRLRFPRPPLGTVTSVKYYDVNGTEQTLASTYYLTRAPWRQAGTIELAPDQDWPDYQDDRTFPITIRFSCGYGAAAVVPPEAKQAIMLTVESMYRNRGSVDLDAMKSIVWLLESLGYGSYA